MKNVMIEVRISMTMLTASDAGAVVDFLAVDKDAKVRANNRRIEGRARIWSDRLPELTAFVKANAERGNLQHENPEYPVLFRTVHIEPAKYSNPSSNTGKLKSPIGSLVPAKPKE